MNYATIKKHDIANGPGVRVSLFVSGCTQPELVQYLKERRLYINEPVETEVEL